MTDSLSETPYPLTAPGAHGPAQAFEAVAERAFEPLSPRALLVDRVGSIGFSLLPAIGIGVAVRSFLEPGEVAAAVLGSWLLITAVSWWLAGVRHRYRGFRLDDDGLAIRRGVLIRSETFVPRSRVQHTDVNRGPVERYFGLATLKVFTAGTKMNAIPLAGLPLERAQNLRDALIRSYQDAV